MAELSLKVVFDNKSLKPALEPGWGFACVIYLPHKTILFDTGADGGILMENMQKMNVDPEKIEAVVLSHAHWDHANGLGALLTANSRVTIYLPQSFPDNFKQSVRDSGAQVEEISNGGVLFEGVYTTGEMQGIIAEQALAIKTSRGLVVITGCAHPGIVNIVRKAKELTGENVYLVLGGFHFPERSVVDSFRELGVQKAAPCHCSGNEAIEFISEDYGNDAIQVGVGLEFDIE